MKRDLKLFIGDILENITLIEDSTGEVSRYEFKSNRLIIDATIRRLEKIGEATKNIPEKIRRKYPEIEWKKIADIRGIIIPTYFQLDLDLVWGVIKNKLPDLKKKILKIKKDLESEKKKQQE